MKRTMNRVLIHFLCAALALGLLSVPVSSGAAAPQPGDPVSFDKYSWNGSSLQTTTETVTSGNYTAVTGNLIKDNPDGLTSGNYVVFSSATINEYLYIRTGCTVNLIVLSGATLTAKKGIGCGLDKNGQYASLNIYGTGTVKAYGDDLVAGIGGKNDETNGNIAIHGATVVATGGHHAAGIGGGDGGKDPDGTTSIKIYQGTVNATGGTDGAGIGGGNCQPGAHTYIYDGTVTAQGGKHGAGIGGGDEEGTLGVFIYGGTITATGGEHGAGIGAGEEGGNLRKSSDGGGINISGGTLNITGGSGAAGIGGGYDEDTSGTVVISGSAKGTIRGGYRSAGIGGGMGADPKYGDMKGTVTINGTGGLLEIYGGREGAGIGAGSSGNFDGTFHMTGGQVFVQGGYKAAGIGGGCEQGDHGGQGGDCYLGGGTLTVYSPADQGVAAYIGGGDYDTGHGSVYIHKNNNETGKYMRVARKAKDESTAKAGDRSETCHFNGPSSMDRYLYITECDHKEYFTGESGYDYTFDQDRHTRTCRYCGYAETEDHSFTNGSSVCDVCGYDAGYSFVFFNTEGGSEVPVQKIRNGQKAVRPEDPTNEDGIVFIDWYKITNLMTGETETEPFDFDTVLDHKLIVLKAVWAHGHDGMIFEPWNSDSSLPDSGGDYYLTRDVALSDTWTWSAGTLNLCLNGHTVNGSGVPAGGEFDSPSVLEVTGGVFHLYDETGGGVSQAAVPLVRVTGGEFILHGGTVSGSTKTGVYVSGGTFRMNGGTVTGNQFGVQVTGSGVFAVSGAPRVTGNTSLNAFLSHDKTIRIDGELKSRALIGVTLYTAPGVFTEGLSGEGGTDNFTSDEAEYMIGLNAASEAVLGAPATLTLDPDTEEGEVRETVVAAGSAVILPEIDSADPDMAFVGWLPDGEDDPLPAGTTYTVRRSITLTAVWEDVGPVAAPVFTPEAGALLPSQTVTLTCETENAVIHYTTDGAAPTEESPVYTEPIPIYGSTVIKAIAIRGDMTSGIASAVYNLPRFQASLTPGTADGTAVPGEMIMISGNDDKNWSASGEAENGRYFMDANGDIWFCYPECPYAAPEGCLFIGWLNEKTGETGVPGTLCQTRVFTLTAQWDFWRTPDFVLPENTAAVEESAFEGDAAFTVVDAGACLSLGANAFRNCTGLTQIKLPKDCAIGDGAFDGCSSLRAVFAPAGGSTQTWAEAHRIPFVAIPEN